MNGLFENGFARIPAVLSPKHVLELKCAVEPLGPAAGHRQLMQRIPEVASLATSPQLLDYLRAALEDSNAKPVPVRSILFDKSPEANWPVAWHQDLTISVAQKAEIPGYGPWSIKEGVPHVQPPISVLDNMVTARLHLDDCDESNGALQVIPGSHRHGRLDSHAIARFRAASPVTLCTARAGDLLLMRPLILHASAPATHPTHRRIIHIEYTLVALPEPLIWAEHSH